MLLAMLMLTAVFSCNRDKDDNSSDPESIDGLVVERDFDWATTTDSHFKITALDNQDNPIEGAKMNIYTKDPDKGGTLIVSGVTNADGIYEIDYQVPAYYDSLFVLSDFVGLVNETVVQLSNGGFDLLLGGVNDVEVDPEGKVAIYSKEADAAGFTYMGNYSHSDGYPYYLVHHNDVIDRDFLKDVNRTLPEGDPLFETHPEYMENVYNHNVNLIETGDVWVTFITEGADFHNVLCYYTYPTNQAPATVNDIETLYVIFPNVSARQSGGRLSPGNKVYLGRFNANTTISWALMADGWMYGRATEGKWQVYSTKEFNPASNSDLKQQSVLIKDIVRERLILGIEDIRRDDSGCDHDFNDAIFYVTANPFQAIDGSDLPIVDYDDDEEDDTDGDGTPDTVDDYPDDPDKAFNNYFFTKGNFGSLVYEDLWPDEGDYDFNDAVIDYNFNQITNTANDVVEIKATYILRAHGAGYENGFGIELPINPSAIESVTGTHLTEDYIVNDANGTENGQDNAVVIIWDNAYTVLPQVYAAIGVNTTQDIPFTTPDTLNVVIKLKDPVSMAELGLPPFNPFIIVDGVRGVEVHLSDHTPTSLVDMSLFGTGDDNSNPAEGRYYKNDKNLPWGINIIERFDYPYEKIEITATHLKFAPWAESSGEVYPDWYKDLTGYRNEANIYNEPTE